MAAEQSARIAELLKDAPEPVAGKKLKDDLRARERWKPKEVTAFLKQAVAEGAVYAWPKSRFWARNPADVARSAALDLSAEAAMPKKELIAQTGARSFGSGKAATGAVAALLGSGALKKAKLVGKTELIYRAGDLRGLVTASYGALARELRKLGLVEAPEVTPPVEPGAALADRILEAVKRLQPGPAVPVTVQALRSAMPGVGKTEFDRAVIQLADRLVVYLTSHDHGWALAEAEREQLVFDGGQKLYVAVTLRD